MRQVKLYQKNTIKQYKYVVNLLDSGNIKIDVLEYMSLLFCYSITIGIESIPKGHMIRYFNIGMTSLVGVKDTMCGFYTLKKIYQDYFYQNGIPSDNEVINVYVPSNDEDPIYVYVQGEVIVSDDPNVELFTLPEERGAFKRVLLENYPEYEKVEIERENTTIAESSISLVNTITYLNMQLDMISKILFSLVENNPSLKNTVLEEYGAYKELIDKAYLNSGFEHFKEYKLNDVNVVNTYITSIDSIDTSSSETEPTVEEGTPDTFED